jgi:serine/threonine-protein kinase
MRRENDQADDTLLAAHVTDARAEHVSLPPLVLREGAGEQRYRQDRVLGEGGMGIVTLCRDERIGRSVALKVLRHEGADDDAQRRFLREAQLQGQLEHPAVVPVYDIATRADGSLFFTMKRVRGVTLQEIIAGLYSGDAAVAAKYPRHRLLGAFAQVCLAIEFAHRRGVVHRELQPSNVMLGDFGEVYVLDWGIAKLADGDAEERSSATDLAAFPDAATQTGAVLGNPG